MYVYAHIKWKLPLFCPQERIRTIIISAFPSLPRKGLSGVNQVFCTVSTHALYSHRPCSWYHSAGTSLCVLSRSVMFDSLQPLDYSPPASSVHRILQARILEWVAFPFFRENLPNPRMEPRSPALQADSLPSELPEKPRLCYSVILPANGNWHETVLGVSYFHINTTPCSKSFLHLLLPFTDVLPPSQLWMALSVSEVLPWWR